MLSHHSATVLTCAGLCVFAVTPPVAVAQATVPLEPRREIRAAAAPAAPVIDGQLDEPLWRDAAETGGFVQREPREGTAASERTTVRIAAGDHAIYFGIVLEDSEPERVTAALHGRDLWKLTGLWDYAGPDDSIAILLDTFRDGRNGYYFAVNPNGAMTDALITGEGLNRNFEWDGVWRAAARRHAGGWTAEIAIPFSTLRYPAASDDTGLAFGLNLQRVIRRKNEESFWAPVELSGTLWWFSRAGRLAGMLPRQQRRVAEVKPFVVARASRTAAAATDADFQPGIDVRLGLTSSVTLDVTANTDFAQVEVDDEQINFTRFSLYFPEKREFFLEGAGVFNFGFRNESKLFFSRRIGLDAGGREVPMLAGARASGRAGPYEFGAIAARTGKTASVRDATQSVLRVRRQLFGRSSVGAMLTDVRSEGAGNRVVGIDSDLTMFRYMTVNSFWAGTFPSAGDGKQAFATNIYAHWDTDALGIQYIFHDFDAGFAPALGFFPRVGVRRQSPGGRVAWRPQRGPVRRYLIRTMLDWFHDEAGRQRTRAHMTQLIVTLQNGDELLVQGNHNTETPERSFVVGRNTVVPANAYRFERGQIRYAASPGRRYAATGSYSWGGFYGGTRQQVQLSATAKVTDHFALLPSYERNDVRLPFGHFTATLAGVRLNYSASNRVISNTFVQYNNITRRLTANFRLDLIYRPNSHVYVVVNDTRDVGMTPLEAVTRDRAIILKVVHLLKR